MYAWRDWSEIAHKVAHDVEKTEIGETPAGSETLDHITRCGLTISDWCGGDSGLPESHTGSEEDVKRAGIPYCKTCMALLNNIEKKLKRDK